DLGRVAELPFAVYARFDGEGGVVLADNRALRRFRLAAPSDAIVLRRGDSQPIARLANGRLAAGVELVDLAAATTRPFAPEVSPTETSAIDRTRVITGGYDHMLRIWDLERAARPLAIFAASDATEKIAVDRSGTRAASVGRRGVVE